MGMETACLGLAIASLAFWALTVAEVGIYAWLTITLSHSINIFLLEIIFMMVPFAKVPFAFLLVTQCGDAAVEWKQVDLWILFVTNLLKLHSAAEWSVGVYTGEKKEQGTYYWSLQVPERRWGSVSSPK